MDPVRAGQAKTRTYNLAIRKRILETQGVKSILSFNTPENRHEQGLHDLLILVWYAIWLHNTIFTSAGSHQTHHNEHR